MSKANKQNKQVSDTEIVPAAPIGAPVDKAVEPAGVQTASRGLDTIERDFVFDGYSATLPKEKREKVTADDFTAIIAAKVESASRGKCHAAHIAYQASLVSADMFKLVSERVKAQIPGNRGDVVLSMARRTIPALVNAGADLTKVALDSVYNCQAAIFASDGKVLETPEAKQLLDLVKQGASDSKLRTARKAIKDTEKAEAEKKAEADKAAAETPEAKQKAKDAAEGKEYANALASANLVRTYLAARVTSGTINAKELQPLVEQIRFSAQIAGFDLVPRK